MDWLTTTWPDIGFAVLSSVAIFAAIILFVRLTGLRSFSKMSAPDFALTVAVGSLFANVISTPKPTLGLALPTLLSLFALQWLTARLKRMGADTVLDNQPLLLMAGSTVLEDNLKRANVTMDDLRAKLREANVLQMSQVLAVVLETTGDVSVLHSSKDLTVDRALLADVVDADRLPG